MTPHPPSQQLQDTAHVPLRLCPKSYCVHPIEQKGPVFPSETRVDAAPYSNPLALSARRYQLTTAQPHISSARCWPSLYQPHQGAGFRAWHKLYLTRALPEHGTSFIYLEQCISAFDLCHTMSHQFKVPPEVIGDDIIIYLFYLWNLYPTFRQTDPRRLTI